MANSMEPGPLERYRQLRQRQVTVPYRYGDRSKCTVLTLTLIRRGDNPDPAYHWLSEPVNKQTLMDNLTPSDLFSPSKARQQRAQAQDWAHIDSWLSYKYSGRSVPTFERNEETLKVLRELSMANERADEERTVMQRLEREALKELDEV
jgi:hypothetical protein